MRRNIPTEFLWITMRVLTTFCLNKDFAAFNLAAKYDNLKIKDYGKKRIVQTYKFHWNGISQLCKRLGYNWRGG